MAKRKKSKDEVETPPEEVPVEAVPDVVETEAGSDGGGVTLIDPNPALTAANQEVSSLQARLRAVSAAYKELQDEVQATKERLERQAQLRRELQRGQLVATLFEPLDNLKRSIDAIGADGLSGDARTGLELVTHQFMEAFRNLGLEEVLGKGHPFDPNLHEAISIMPVTEPAMDGLIIEVFSAGYRVGNQLLQPARVVIGQLESPEADPVEDAPEDA